MTKACKFCGQVVETYDELAEGWEVCSCAGAQNERKLKERWDDAEDIIEEIFNRPEDECGFQPVRSETLTYLYTTAGQILMGKIVSASIGLEDGSRATMRLTKNGGLDISRTAKKNIGNQTK